jgi:hypothetical protein
MTTIDLSGPVWAPVPSQPDQFGQQFGTLADAAAAAVTDNNQSVPTFPQGTAAWDPNMPVPAYDNTFNPYYGAPPQTQSMEPQTFQYGQPQDHSGYLESVYEQYATVYRQLPPVSEQPNIDHSQTMGGASADPADDFDAEAASLLAFSARPTNEVPPHYGSLAESSEDEDSVYFVKAADRKVGSYLCGVPRKRLIEK